MEFLSPKTKAHIEQLEAELAKLRAQEPKTKVPLWSYMVMILLAAALVAGYFLRPVPTDEELRDMQVQIWREGVQIDTVFTPTSGLKYSVQIGAYKNLDIKELSYGFSELSVRESEGVKRVVLGEYSSLPDAQAFLTSVVEMGFENAFVVAYKDGIAVGLLENETATN